MEGGCRADGGGWGVSDGRGLSLGFTREESLEMDGGHGRTAAWRYGTPPNWTLKSGQNGIFYVMCIFTTIKKMEKNHRREFGRSPTGDTKKGHGTVEPVECAVTHLILFQPNCEQWMF